MRSVRLTLLIGGLLWVLAAAPAVWAGPATEAVQGPIDRGLEILKDPKYAAPEMKTAQRKAMWHIIKEAFDFKQVSMRAVARPWLKFSAEEKAEFTRLFAQLLGDTYLSRIQEGFQNDAVVYLGEKVLSDRKVIVNTKIPRANADLMIDYSVLKTAQGWKIYDVNVEGVGLVRNYRSQFKDILAQDPPAKLIEILRKKVDNPKP